MSQSIPAIVNPQSIRTEADIAKDFLSAASKMLEAASLALSSGQWSPDPDQDVDAICARLSRRIVRGKFRCNQDDVSLVRDLCDIALSAMDHGAWVTPGKNVGLVQSCAFLAELLDDAPVSLPS